MSNKEFTSRPFEKLKKRIAEASTTAAPSSAPFQRTKKEDYTDEELFSREMGDVQEIAEFRSLVCEKGHGRQKSATRLLRDPEKETVAALGEIATGARPMHLPHTQEYLEWTNPAYHDTIIPGLHEGRFSVEAYLDLHGFTVHEAEEELDLFLEESMKTGLRCVKIIHGRGLRSNSGPRVKDAVARRLAGHHRKKVIAYVTARQCDGGLGALYVLLRKKQNHTPMPGQRSY